MDSRSIAATASYRSNPYKISEFTLQRKDPQYVPNAKAAQAFEKARLAGDAATAQKFYSVLHAVGINADDPEVLSQPMKSTGLGSVLYAKRPCAEQSALFLYRGK